LIRNKSDKVAELISRILKPLPIKIKYSLLNLVRNINGKKGIILRSAIVKTMASKCGYNIMIFPGSFLSHIENVKLGNNISIHPMCYIDGAGGLTIGNDVSIAHGVTIMTTEHRYENLNVPIREQGYKFHEVYIGNNVWVGSKVTLLAGTTIENGIIIGANALVNKKFESNSIIAGVPAQIIKNRK
jgi:acetyltransferase-like isoleucine patch superfamily enzyme